MKRLLVVLVGVLILLAGALGSAFVVLAMSEPGTRFLAAQAERFLPLRVEGVHGTLWRSLTAERVSYALAGREVIVEALAIELRLFPVLFDNRLELESVQAARVSTIEREPRAAAGDPVRLALPFMPIDIRLDRLEVARIEWPGIPVVAVHGAAEWSARGLRVDSLEVSGEALEAALSGTLGSGLRPTLEADVRWALPEAGWQGAGTLVGPVDRLEVRHAIEGAYPAEIAGTANLAVPAEPSFDLLLTLADAALADYRFRDLAGRLAGDPGALTLTLRAELATPYGDPFPVDAVARGPAAGPIEFEVGGAPLGGSVAATGSVAWGEGLRLTVTGTASDLGLAPFLEDLEGRVGGRFAVHLEAGRFDVTLEDVAGAIDGRALGGRARLEGAARSWTAEHVELTLGDNRAEFSGSWLDGVVAIDGRVAAPALAQLGLGIEGDVIAEVDVAGTWPALDGTVDLRSNGLVRDELAVEGLRTAARLAGGRVQGELAAVRLGAAGVDLESVTLVVAGPLEAVDWELAWAEGAGRGRFRWLADALHLDVAALRVDVLEHRLTLAGPAGATLANGNLRVAPACIEGADGRACLERFDLQAGRIATAGRLEHLPLVLLAGLLPLAGDDAGHLEGRWDVAGSGMDWSGSIALAGRGLGIVLPEAADQRIGLPDVVLEGELAGGGLDVRISARDDLFTLDGTARLAELRPDGALRGTVGIVADDLGWLRALDQRIAELGGTLSGRAVLSGTAGAPRVEGLVELGAGRIAIEDPEFRLDAITLTARLDETGEFAFEGAGSQPGGQVRINGTGSGLFGGDLAFDATLTGRGLQAEHPQWEVQVAPDLALAYANGRARLTGVVEVPAAEVRLNTLPTTVPRPSADVVVVGRDEVDAGQINRLRVNVRVVLGRDVRLRAFGIQADLEGALNVRRDARGQTSVRGTLDITGGLLSAQGQTLAIESGTVIYNGPVANPYIDVRAVRSVTTQAQTVKVGLHIRGDADRLQSSVISEPAMAENRALAFLVLGRDINEQSDSDSGQLLTAAINLGLSQSKSLTSELQRITGLDEFSAMAEAQDSFAIVAGKRITQDLYVRYTYNTLTAVGAILVSLDLTRRWRLEATSGENSAMDILYRFER